MHAMELAAQPPSFPDGGDVQGDSFLHVSSETESFGSPQSYDSPSSPKRSSMDTWRRGSVDGGTKPMTRMSTDSMRGFLVPPPSSFSRSSISRTSHSMPQRFLGADAASFMAMPGHAESNHAMEPIVSDGHLTTNPFRGRMATIFCEIWSDDGGVDEAIEKSTASTPRLPRAYYLDWMRIVSIYLVIISHVIQSLTQIGAWCSRFLGQEMAFRSAMLQIALPIFFHTSGRAQALAALAKPLRLPQLVARRSARLLVPFVVCYIMLIPMWRWISERDQISLCKAVGKDEKNLTQYDTSWTASEKPQGLFEFIVCYWSDSKCFEFDPDWLWFLPTFFAVTVFCTPLFLFAESLSRRYLAIFCLFLLGQNIAASLVLSVSLAFNAFLVIAPLAVVVVIWKVPVPEVQEDRLGSQLERFYAIRVVTAAHVIATVGAVCSFRYTDIEQDRLKVFPGLFMYPLFYIQGFFVQRYWPERGGSKRIDTVNPIASFQGATPDDSPASSMVSRQTRVLPNLLRGYEFVIILVFYLVILLGSPTGERESNFWPVYSASFHDGEDFHAIIYVFFTWAWIGLSSALFQAYANEPFNHKLHHHASNSAMVVYIFHYAFLKPFVWFIVRDTGMLKTSFLRLFAVPFSLLFAVGCSLLVYALLLRCPRLGAVFGI